MCVTCQTNTAKMAGSRNIKCIERNKQCFRARKNDHNFVVGEKNCKNVSPKRGHL